MCQLPATRHSLFVDIVSNYMWPVNIEGMCPQSSLAARCILRPWHHWNISYFMSTTSTTVIGAITVWSNFSFPVPKRRATVFTIIMQKYAVTASEEVRCLKLLTTHWTVYSHQMLVSAQRNVWNDRTLILRYAPTHILFDKKLSGDMMLLYWEYQKMYPDFKCQPY